jgi:hypothetical protein
MESLLANILQSSFSVAVAAYLLVRMESRLDGLTNAIVRLGSTIDTLVTRGGANHEREDARPDA